MTTFTRDNPAQPFQGSRQLLRRWAQSKLITSECSRPTKLKRRFNAHGRQSLRQIQRKQAPRLTSASRNTYLKTTQEILRWPTEKGNSSLEQWFLSPRTSVTRIWITENPKASCNRCKTESMSRKGKCWVLWGLSLWQRKRPHRIHASTGRSRCRTMVQETTSATWMNSRSPPLTGGCWIRL